MVYLAFMVGISRPLPDAPNRIREHRLAAGLTQDELGRRAGVPKSNLVRYERGDRNCPLHAMRLLADALGVPVGALLRPEDNPPMVDDSPLDLAEISVIQAMRAGGAQARHVFAGVAEGVQGWRGSPLTQT
jgi:transcriptional regulator with XRE-family HTH domain